MTITRRTILTGGATGVGLAVVGALPALEQTAAAAPNDIGNPGGSRTAGTRPFPPLISDPDGILALPEGFSYAIATHEGVSDLSFGQGKTPALHDGTGVVGATSRGFTLIQNHEITPHLSTYGVPHVQGTVYDPGAVNAGGCTVITTNRRGEPTDEWVGISGTLRNCAGGVTPWGTWLTCEETSASEGDVWTVGTETGIYEKDHGYVLEVFPGGDQLPEAIKAFGRYDHEALAVEPGRRHVYLSEDASSPNGLFYRWTAPDDVRLGPRLAERLDDTSGTLEAMQIRLDDGSVLPDVAYLSSAQLGRAFPVTWVPVPERDATTTPVRKQFADGEVTRGKKFEGVWSDGSGAYVVNSFAFGANDLPADATKHDGMVWFYNYWNETITLVSYFPHNTAAQNQGPAPRYTDLTFDAPDNVTVTPWGTLVLAEDGTRASHVLSTVPGGPTYAIARNELSIGTTTAGDPTYSEFSGPTFSPDGKVLFVNIMRPGLTLAITGPWRHYLS